MNARRSALAFPDCLGLDGSKAKLEGGLLNAVGDGLARTQGANDAKGFARRRAGRRRVRIDAARVRVVLEATGVYGRALVELLHAAGLAVAGVNPAPVKSFGVAGLRRSQNDGADAVLIARDGLERRPVPEGPRSEAERTLKARRGEREARVGDLTREKNRLEKDRALGRSSLPEVLRRRRQVRLRQRPAQRDELDAALAAHVEADPALQAQAALLTSRPGVGALTAAQLLARLAGKAVEDGRPRVAYAGLNPAHHPSGPLRGTTTRSKVGPAFLRKARCLPAAVARRYGPALRRGADGLASRGLNPLQVRGALMRKRLRAAFAVLKPHTPFDPTKLCLPQTP
jgi:transposase